MEGVFWALLGGRKTKKSQSSDRNTSVSRDWELDPSFMLTGLSQMRQYMWESSEAIVLEHLLTFY